MDIEEKTSEGTVSIPIMDANRCSHADEHHSCAVAKGINPLDSPKKTSEGTVSIPIIMGANRCSHADEHHSCAVARGINPLDSPKARKPYTITKQREKWTDEEHQKFLEALKLHGRGWRHIEEHVGTKTAVQIRSHAQKFFSKLSREGSDTVEIFTKPIEIPPPRPKRKPVHPYPRKIVDSATKEVTLSSNDPQERSPSPNNNNNNNNNIIIMKERVNRSPTSVFSNGGSDALNLPVSPTSCASDSCTEEEKRSLSSSPMILDLNSKENLSSKGGDVTSFEAPSKTFKLFGQTFLVEKQSDAFPTDNFDALASNEEEEVCYVDPLTSSDQLNIEFSLGEIYKDNSESAPLVTSKYTCLPWWSLYNNCVPFSYFPLYSQTLPMVACRTEDKEIVSCSGIGEAELFDVDDGNKTQLKRGHPCNSTKGFVPYKKCFTQTEVINSPSLVGMEESDGQRLRVCL